MGWGGGVVEFAISSDVFKHICDRHSPHTDISNVGGYLACGLLFQEQISPSKLKSTLKVKVCAPTGTHSIP